MNQESQTQQSNHLINNNQLIMCKNIYLLHELSGKHDKTSQEMFKTKI